jgi:hypothetical protein
VNKQVTPSRVHGALVPCQRWIDGWWLGQSLSDAPPPPSPPPPPPHRFGLMLALFFCASLARLATAAELAPSWTALPEETVLMLRMPAGEAFLDALRKQTKLGAVVFSPDRMRRLAEVIRTRSPEGLDELRETLGRLDLKPEDWKGLFRGDLGVAVTLEPRGKQTPLVVLLGWLEPGEELAPRLVSALQAVLADHTDEAFAPKRQDMELAGHNVMHIEISVPGVVMPPLPETDDAENESDNKLQQQIEERLKEAKVIESDRVHFFIAQLGGRLVWGGTVPQSSDEVEKKTDAERAAIDWDALTGLEAATAKFGRFLAAHEGSGEGGARRLLETPGLEASLPSGAPLIEVLADPRQLLKLAEAAGESTTKRALEALGATSVGPLALRASLDGATFRSGIFLSASAPRAGLLALLDQPALPPEPPVWAPTAAIGYQQLSFDIGKAYRRLKDLAIEQSGGSARQNFDQVESLAKTFLQVDLNDLLTSLGEQYSMVTFTPRAGESAETDAGDESDGKTKAPAAVQRIGIVCKVSDEQIWQQLLQVASRFIQGGAAGGLKAVEEQGFSGYRAEQGGNEVGIFVGHGYLVVGVGPEVSESVLSVLRSPPEGEAALRGSGLVDRGRALISPRPCLAYRISDAGANVKITRQKLQSLLELPLSASLGGTPASAVGAGFELFSSSTPDDRKDLVEKIKSLLPSDDELEGVLGVSIGQTVVTDDGLVIESALELPSP